MDTWKIISIMIAMILTVFFIFFFVVALTSCTLSFQNISTHGMASDVVDEKLDTDPTVSPTISIPLKAL